MTEREKILRLALSFCRKKFENISNGGVNGLKIAPGDIVKMAEREVEDIDLALKLADEVRVTPKSKKYRYALEQIQNEAGQGADSKFLAEIAYDAIQEVDEMKGRRRE